MIVVGECYNDDATLSTFIVWVMRVKIIRTVLCRIVYCSCTQSYAHSQAVRTSDLGPVGLGFPSVFV